MVSRVYDCTLLVAHEIPVSIHDKRNWNPVCDHGVWKMAHFDRFARGSPLYGEGGGDPRERALRSIFSKLLHRSGIMCMFVICNSSQSSCIFAHMQYDSPITVDIINVQLLVYYIIDSV